MFILKDMKCENFVRIILYIIKKQVSETLVFIKLGVRRLELLTLSL